MDNPLFDSECCRQWCFDFHNSYSSSPGFDFFPPSISRVIIMPDTHTRPKSSYQLGFVCFLSVFYPPRGIGDRCCCCYRTQQPSILSRESGYNGTRRGGEGFACSYLHSAVAPDPCPPARSLGLGLETAPAAVDNSVGHGFSQQSRRRAFWGGGRHCRR